MEILLLIIKIVFLIYFCGSGIFYLFLGAKFKGHAYALIPWLGIASIITLGVIFSIAKVPMLYAKNLILLSSILIFLRAIINKKIYSTFNKINVYLIFLGIILVFYLLQPLFKVGYPTTISLGNLDAISYTNVADHLITHTVLEKNIYLPFKPYLWPIGDLVYNSYRWGSPMLLSFFSAILNFKSYYIFSVLINIIFVLIFPLIYSLSKIMFNLKKDNIILLILLFITFGINSTMLYMLNNIFFAQFIFIGLFISFLIVINSYLNDDISSKGFDIKLLISALFLSTITSTYPEGLIFIILPLMFYCVVAFFTKEKNRQLLFLLKVGFLTFLINPVTFGTATRQIYSVFLTSINTTFIGWEKIRFANIVESLGFWNLYYSKSLPSILVILLSLGGLYFIFKGLMKSKNILLSSTLLVFTIGILLYYKFINQNFYFYHRFLIYYLFFISILFSIGLADFINKIKINYLKYAICIILILISFRSTLRTNDQMYYHARIVDKSLISLEYLNNNEITQTFYTADIFLGEYDLWTRLWQEYFLNKKNIVSIQNYPTDKKLTGNISLVLVEKITTKRNNVELKINKIYWENNYYKLGEFYVKKL